MIGDASQPPARPMPGRRSWVDPLASLSKPHWTSPLKSMAITKSIPQTLREHASIDGFDTLDHFLDAEQRTRPLLAGLPH
jgi:hypothetical protein